MSLYTLHETDIVHVFNIIKSSGIDMHDFWIILHTILNWTAQYIGAWFDMYCVVNETVDFNLFFLLLNTYVHSIQVKYLTMRQVNSLNWNWTSSQSKRHNFSYK